MKPRRENSVEYAPVLKRHGVAPATDGLWLTSGVPDRRQGWKLHVSSVPAEAEDVLDAVVPFLLENELAFKVVRDEEVLKTLNEGRHGLTQVGKFLSVYPPSDAEAVCVSERLVELTRTFRGPSVPTDLHLGGTVYTRYGGFDPIVRRNRLGLTEQCIRLPDGSLRPDERTIPFTVPDGVSNPFERTSSPGDDRASATDREADLAPKNVLGPGYRIADVLKPDVRGSVFLAFDFTVEDDCGLVVLKQGRANYCADEHGRDIRERLRRQRELHRTLGDSVPIPESHPYFESGGDGYLPLEFIDGRPLEPSNPRPYSALPDDDRRSLLRDVLATLDSLAALHSAGYVHRDLTPKNVLVTPDGTAYLLDLELAHRVGSDEPPFTEGTTGFVSPQQLAGRPPAPSDDVFSLGSTLTMLLSGVAPATVRFADEERRERQLDVLTGAPSALTEVVSRCLRTNPEERPSLKDVRERVRRVLNSMNTERRAGTNSSIAETNYRKHNPSSNGILSSRNEQLRAATIGLLNDVPLDSDTRLWLSTQPGDDLHAAVNEKKYALYRSANRGVAGPLYVLSRLARTGIEQEESNTRSERAVDWLLAHHDTPDDQLPGLHFGEAGVTVAIAEAVGADVVESGDWLEEYLHEALSGPLDWPDVTHGAAGQALATFICADVLNEPGYARHADDCIDYLLEMQDEDGGWTLPGSIDGVSRERYTGFAHGTAGILFALVEYDQRAPNPRVSDAYESGARWLLRAADTDGDAPSWPISESDGDAWKWWCHGTSGIVLALLRLYEATDDEEYARVARQALYGLPKEPRSSNLGLCHGLCGIGEVYLEAARVLKDPEWMARAERIGEQVLSLGRHSKGGGLTWPVESPDRPTGDLMVGSAGVTHFLLRLSERGRELTFPLLPAPS